MKAHPSPRRSPDARAGARNPVRRGPRRWLWASSIAAAVALLGCSSGTQLEPADSANTAARGTPYATTNGVRVFAQGDGWTGDSEVSDFVTPVYLAIENGGDQPVRVRYSNMKLVSDDGESFEALPPFDVHGTVTKNVDRLVPRFGYRDAALAPYFANVYEGVEVEPPPGYMDYEYYDQLYDNWRAEIPLPTQFMQEVALPEAMVRPRGQLSGFVYFQHVPSSKQHVTLDVNLIDADSGSSLGRARIPFVVDD